MSRNEAKEFLAAVKHIYPNWFQPLHPGAAELVMRSFHESEE